MYPWSYCRKKTLSGHLQILTTLGGSWVDHLISWCLSVPSQEAGQRDTRRHGIVTYLPLEPPGLVTLLFTCESLWKLGWMVFWVQGLAVNSSYPTALIAGQLARPPSLLLRPGGVPVWTVPLRMARSTGDENAIASLLSSSVSKCPLAFLFKIPQFFYVCFQRFCLAGSHVSRWDPFLVSLYSRMFGMWVNAFDAWNLPSQVFLLLSCIIPCKFCHLPNLHYHY